MAPPSHGTVKKPDTQSESAHNADEVMTLATASGAEKLPVHFSASPFLLDNDTLRDIIDNAALHRPQAVAVVIDEPAYEQHPDLMLSIQTYCVQNDDVIKLESIEVVAHDAQLPALDSPSDIAVVLGSQKLLEKLVESDNDDKTLVYIPNTLNDQLNLHQLLQIDQQLSLIGLINTGIYSDTDDERRQAGVDRAMELARAQDAQFFDWIETNKSMLDQRHPDTLNDLIKQYCSLVASAESK